MIAEFTDVRTVVLKKKNSRLGFKFIGGEYGEPIFISFILTGGPADLSGELRRGDQILNVNEINLRNATHEEAARALKSKSRIVTIVVQYRPEEYNRFQAKINKLKEEISQSVTGTLLQISQKRSFYVRALFEYDPMKDDDLPGKGLAFHFCDILHIINASNDKWWQARRVLNTGDEQEIGIVPSKCRWERKKRPTDRSVKFEDYSHNFLNIRSTVDKKEKNFSFRQKFSLVRNKDKKSEDNPSNSDRTSCTSNARKNVLSYIAVQQIVISYMRPVVILGLLKERITNYLVTEFPDKFQNCVSHATRPELQQKVDKNNCHFVSSQKQIEEDEQSHQFLEAEFDKNNDDLSETLVASVREIADKGKHCILEITTHKAIKRLQAAQLFPIVIFIKPKSIESIMEISKRIREEQAKNTVEQSLNIVQEFGEYITAVVQKDTSEGIYEAVKKVIKEQSGPTIWVPTEEKL